VAAVVADVPFFLVPVFGYVSALISLIVVYRLACRQGVLSVTNLLLIGIVFNSFSYALILLINSVANFGQAQQILYLLLGSIDPISWQRLGVLAVFVVMAAVVIFLRAGKLNILSLGDEEAFHLGVNVNREKKILFVVTSLLVGASVSLCGLIGFVGLIVPHLARILYGADNRISLPAAALIGGILLMVCEFAAGNLLSFETLNTRLPVGAVTALIGAPVFVWLLKHGVKSL
jgi:iron complex transport system permease protein